VGLELGWRALHQWRLGAWSFCNTVMILLDYMLVFRSHVLPRVSRLNLKHYTGDSVAVWSCFTREPRGED